MVHASTTSEISPKLARQLAGRCCYGACHEAAADGDYCAPHEVHEKARKKGKDRRRIARLAKAGVCMVAGCGAKVGKRKRKDGTVVRRRRCARCSEIDRKRVADLRRSPDRSRRSPGAPTTTTKLELGRDGATRTRYVPRPGQGGPSRVETRRSRSKLVADAARLVAVWQANYDEDTHVAIDALPRIQRTEAISLRTSALVRALRLLGLVAEEEDPGLKGTCIGCGRAHGEE